MNTLQTAIKFNLLLFIAISTFSCSGDGGIEMEIDESRLPVSEVPELYFQWTINGQESIADQEYIGANLFNVTAINIGGATGSSVSGDWVNLQINRGNNDSVQPGDSYMMDSDSDDEIRLIYPDGTEWSTKNPNGSGSCSISSFQAYHDVLFTADFIEGTFSATLTSLTESGEVTITNGAFGSDFFN